MDLGETLQIVALISVLAAWLGSVGLVLIDVFSSRDLSGPAKAGWVVLVTALIWFGVALYLMARGGGIRQRAEARAERRQPAPAPASESGSAPAPDRTAPDGGEPGSSVLDEAITIGLYVSIVLLSVLVGVGGGGDPAEDLALLWGTTVGLLLAHWFAVRLTRAFVMSRPVPSRDEVRAGAAIVAAAGIATGLATLPYLFDISALTASTAASFILLIAIGVTGFASVQRGGGTLRRSLAFAALVVVVAAVVVAVKYQLAH